MYMLGNNSRAELEGVHPDLVAVVKRAIEIVPVDFTVLDGLRTPEEQAEYVQRGVSKTMASKHLRQEDGFGHAVDLVPFINGKVRWEMQACIQIAREMATAAAELKVRIVWGGGWAELGTHDAAEIVTRYIEHKRKWGEPVFIDGPHYELATIY